MSAEGERARRGPNGSPARNGSGAERADALADAIAARRRARAISGLRGLAKPGVRDASVPGTRARAADADASPLGGQRGPSQQPERCDICGTSIPDDHRHLLQLLERRIECVCESCWALRSGDAEYRPTGSRTVWLAELRLPDDLWATFQIPIGLAFFMQSSTAGCVVAMYPSPAGATESELHFASWSRMVELNPLLGSLEPDVEGLIVNRLGGSMVALIAPIDRCYELTGLVKSSWEGISGGDRVQEDVAAFLDGLRGAAVSA